MDAVLDRLFQKPGVERVVVEPDARNTKIHALNERLGFQPAGVVDLPDKQALLSFCSHSDYLTARTALQPSADFSTPIHQGASL
jgi:RimJ/RimL family protein N-acetyltransferase